MHKNSYETFPADMIPGNYNGRAYILEKNMGNNEVKKCEERWMTASEREHSH